MISNRILQTTVDGLKAISRVDLCIVDADKNVAAKTFDNVSECLADAISFIDSPAESQAVNGFQFWRLRHRFRRRYRLHRWLLRLGWRRRLGRFNRRWGLLFHHTTGEHQRK